MSRKYGKPTNFHFTLLTEKQSKEALILGQETNSFILNHQTRCSEKPWCNALPQLSWKLWIIIDEILLTMSLHVAQCAFKGAFTSHDKVKLTLLDTWLMLRSRSYHPHHRLGQSGAGTGRWRWWCAEEPVELNVFDLQPKTERSCRRGVRRRRSEASGRSYVSLLTELHRGLPWKTLTRPRRHC